MPDAAATDPVDQIAAALVRLRSRPGPRGPHGHEHPHGPHRWMGLRGGKPGGAGGGPLSGPALFRVFDLLSSRSSPLTVSELGEAIGVDQPRASRLVQQGVDAGMLRRDADPDDARRTRIVLTEQGQAVVQQFRAQRRAAVATALDSFDQAERAELARLLTKLADSWPR